MPTTLQILLLLGSLALICAAFIPIGGRHASILRKTIYGSIVSGIVLGSVLLGIFIFSERDSVPHLPTLLPGVIIFCVLASFLLALYERHGRYK